MMRAFLLTAVLASCALAAPAHAETWCLKSEHRDGPGAPTTYAYQRGVAKCALENRLIVVPDTFGRDAAMIEITVIKKIGE